MFPIINILAYSPRPKKNKANPIAEYSTLYPDTLVTLLLLLVDQTMTISFSQTSNRKHYTLLAEMLHASSSFSIFDPVNPLGRRSHKSRWLSVPSVATS